MNVPILCLSNFKKTECPRDQARRVFASLLCMCAEIDCPSWRSSGALGSTKLLSHASKHTPYDQNSGEVMWHLCHKQLRYVQSKLVQYLQCVMLMPRLTHLCLLLNSAISLLRFSYSASFFTCQEPATRPIKPLVTAHERVTKAGTLAISTKLH